MYRELSITIALAFLFAFMHQGLALDCFSCAEAVNGTCDRINKNQNEDKKLSCPYNETLCYVEVQSHTTPHRILRGCALTNICDDISRVNTSCKTCSSNMCNNHVITADGKVGEPGISSTVKPFLLLNAIGVLLLAYKI